MLVCEFVIGRYGINSQVVKCIRGSVNRSLLPYGRVLDLAPKYRRETNNYYKTADIGARGRVRAEEKKK